MKKSSEMTMKASVIEYLESYIEDIDRNIQYYEEQIKNHEDDNDSYYIKSAIDTVEIENAKKKLVLKLIDCI